METQVLELQELPETDDQPLDPVMCCDTGHHSFWESYFCVTPPEGDC
ncbi:hypothetical protein [Kitasatospora sp. MMS16-BH015]|nr:hypothetical protein [Kitasatospora sp. MMS16-BH015]